MLLLVLLTVLEVDCSVVELGAMVSTAHPCFSLRLWKGYGCYCGLGSCGAQRTVDCLDSCCREHDRWSAHKLYHPPSLPSSKLTNYDMDCIN